MDKVRMRLLDKYHTQGLMSTIALTDQFLKVSSKASTSPDDLAITRGELAEIVLEVTVREILKYNPDSFYVKNLVLPKDHYNFTELDVTLFTPDMVYLFESKSYNANKTLTDKCLVEIEGREPRDVYEQNVYHLTVLDEYIRKHNLRKGKAYQLVYFDYSMPHYSLTDNRDEEAKEKVKVMTIQDVLKIKSRPFNRDRSMWETMDMFKTLLPHIEDSDNRMEQHIKNVKEWRDSNE